jgi:hypothetical protein
MMLEIPVDDLQADDLHVLFLNGIKHHLNGI